MSSNKLNVEMVDPSTLRANPWNTNIVSPDNMAKIEASIDRLGMFKPILVRTLEDGSLEILGGEHRNDVAISRGFKEVPVINLGKIDDLRAKEISLVDNGRYGHDDALKLSDLLAELGSAEELGEFLPYSDSELESIFASTSIDIDDLELPEDDEAPPELPTAAKVQTHQTMRFKVPAEDAERVQDVIESIMKSQGFTESDSLTNAGDALVYLVNQFAENE